MRSATCPDSASPQMWRVASAPRIAVGRSNVGRGDGEYPPALTARDGTRAPVRPPGHLVESRRRAQPTGGQMKRHLASRHLAIAAAVVTMIAAAGCGGTPGSSPGSGGSTPSGAVQKTGFGKLGHVHLL